MNIYFIIILIHSIIICIYSIICTIITYILYPHKYIYVIIILKYSIIIYIYSIICIIIIFIYILSLCVGVPEVKYQWDEGTNWTGIGNDHAQHSGLQCVAVCCSVLQCVAVEYQSEEGTNRAWYWPCPQTALSPLLRPEKQKPKKIHVVGHVHKQHVYHCPIHMWLCFFIVSWYEW